MKKSLKASLQIFGVAGLVVLSACNQTPKELDQAADETQMEQAEDEQMMGDDATMMDEDDMMGLPPTDPEEEAVMDPISLQVPYSSPAGDHELIVGMVVSGGVITDAGATMEEGLEHPAVIKWQTAFVENFSEAVVGKSLSELQDVEAIGGASLTTGGFKEAVAEIS